MRNKILERYIFKKLVIAFLSAELIYSLIFFIQNLFILSSLIVEKSAPAGDSIQLVLYMLPKIFTSTIPFSSIFAALLVTFQLSSNSELIAVNSSGISLKEQKKPFVKLGIIVAIIYAVLQFQIVPYSKQKRDNIINKINLQAVVYSFEGGNFNKLSDNFFLYAMKTQKNVFINVIVFNYKNINNFEIMYGKKAVLNLDREKLTLSLTFYNGQSTIVSPKNKLSYSKFSKKALSVSLNEEDFKNYESKKNALSKSTLKNFINFLKNKDLTAYSILIKRLCLILFTFFAFIFGFYFGFTFKRGAVVSGAVVYGFILSFVYLFLLNLFTKMFVHRPALSIVLIFIQLLIFLYLLYKNKIRIEKPLAGRDNSKTSFNFKNLGLKFRNFANDLLNDIDEKLYISLKFPILSRYVLTNFLKIFLMFFVIVQGIYVLSVSLKVLVSVLKHKASFVYAVKYVLYSTLTVYPMLLPFSILLSAMFYFISISANNELTAIKSSGISVFSVVTPVIYFSALISLVMIVFTAFIVPYGNKQLKTLDLLINSNGKEGIINSLKTKNKSILRSTNNPNGFYWCDYYDFEHNVFRNFLSVDMDFNSGKINKIFKTKKLLIKGNNFVLNGNKGTLYVFENNKPKIEINSENPLVWDNLSFFRQLEPMPEEMNQAELRDYISLKKKLGIKPYRFITNYYYRFSSAFASLVLLILGLPFALMNEGRKRKPVSGIGFGFIAIIVYYGITSLFLSLGAKHYLPSFLAAWATNFIFLLVGFYQFTKIKT